MSPTTPLSITPETKVGDLLSAYPALEPVLVAQAPAFANLKNPILRRTVARVATLAQAARVGGLDARALVRALRAAAGQEPGDPGAGDAVGQAHASRPAPAWYREDLVVASVDADAMLARGEHPLGLVNQKARQLGEGQMLVIDSGFVPAPLVDALRARGYEAETFEAGRARFRTCVRPGPGLGA